MTTPYPPPQPPSAPDPYGSPYPPPQFTPHPDGSPYPPPQPATRTMSTWALVLAFLSFVPFAWLGSVGLAIAALVRSAQDRDFGRKRAIAALVVDALWVVGLVALVVLAVMGKLDVDDTKRDASGHVIESNAISALSVRVGDCFDQPALPHGDETTPLGKVTVKPCTEAHHFEAYSEFELESGDYPGQEAIAAEANDRCYAAIEGYAGHPRALRSVRVAFFFPLKGDWVIRHEHAVKCIFFHESKASTTSLKRD
jgi:hypothetical protein